jgi:hypothetical protein
VNDKNYEFLHYVIFKSLNLIRSSQVQIFSSAPCSQTLSIYKGVSKSFRTDRLEQVMQMIQLSATRCSCIAILWVSLVSFTARILCVALNECLLL